MNDARFQYLQETIDLYKKKADDLEAMLVSVMSGLEKGMGEASLESDKLDDLSIADGSSITTHYVPAYAWSWWEAKKAEEEERLRKEEEQRRKVMEQKRADLEKERSGLTRRLQYIEQELAKCIPGTPSGS